MKDGAITFTIDTAIVDLLRRLSITGKSNLFRHGQFLRLIAWRLWVRSGLATLDDIGRESARTPMTYRSRLMRLEAEVLYQEQQFLQAAGVSAAAAHTEASQAYRAEQLAFSGLAFFKGGDHIQALAAFSRASEACAQRRTFRILLRPLLCNIEFFTHASLGELGRLAEAAHHLNTALKLERRSGKGRIELLLGQLHLKMGDEARARAWFLRALRRWKYRKEASEWLETLAT